MWLVQEQHATGRAEWEAMLAHRDADSKQFLYTVRGCEGPILSGSIPHMVFEAEPDSVLARMYNGNWEYYKDGLGRAQVLSNPAHWPLILDWLIFGTIPTHPTPEFLSECSFWQLNRLLAAIEDKQGEVIVTGKFPVDGILEDSHQFVIRKVVIEDCTGFEMKGHICKFLQRLLAANSEASAFRMPFSAFGRDWEMAISQVGCFLYMLKGMPLTQNLCRFAWGPGQDMQQRDFLTEAKYTSGSGGHGFKTFDEASGWCGDPKPVSLDGRMRFAFTVTFCPSKL